MFLVEMFTLMFVGMAVVAAADPKLVKKAATDAASNVLARMRQDAEQIFEAAESILWNVDDETHIFDPADIAILKTAGYRTDSNGLAILIGRTFRVRSLMRAAGTAAEYKAAQDAAAAAARAVAELVSNENFAYEVGSVINTRMAGGAPTAVEKALLDAHAKIAAALAARDKTASRLAAMNEAREALRRRELLPEFINQRCDQSLFHSTAHIRERVLNLRNELNRINRVSEADPASVDGSRLIVSYARRFVELELRIVSQRNGLDVVVGDQWRKHVAELVEHRKAVEAEIALLQPALDKAEADCDADREYWIRRLG